ncbi:MULTISPECIES: phosphoglucosamine mutase [unclassified Prochlorococcus]|uniref:phosphoglucosamine mutase n=1 Tax=unclassified Prochlorococcus TaxID=2627481 RepID=UPI001F4C79F8|nr:MULTISPECIES: phosphoglucosamine mutase [unclassified Prochlorococcus]
MHHAGGRNKHKDIIFFGTDGIRGNAKRLFTNQLIYKIGFWCNKILSNQGPILIGQDSRSSSSRISNGLADSLTSQGREVWLLGLCPTPAVPLLIKKYNLSGGLMISASHNPPEDNGIKIFDANAKKISTEKQRIIDAGLQKEKVINSGRKGDVINRHEILKDYEESLLKTIGLENFGKIPIVLDLCWGSATACGEKIFKTLGSKVTCINAKPDGGKINVNCGSTHLNQLIKAVIESNSEMGFAFDGDADRMIAVDRKGRVVDGDNILFLWGSDLQDKKKLKNQRLIATVMSNLGFEKDWQKRGGILQRTPVGDTHVHQAMIDSKADLGGEQSGHILSRLNDLSGDGLLTAIQLSKICKCKGMQLSDLLDQSFTPYPQRLINIPLGSDSSEDNIYGSEKLSTLIADVQSDIGNEGRVLVRKSGTEPLLRVMIESMDKFLIESWASKISKLAQEELN